MAAACMIAVLVLLFAQSAHPFRRHLLNNAAFRAPTTPSNGFFNPYGSTGGLPSWEGNRAPSHARSTSLQSQKIVLMEGEGEGEGEGSGGGDRYTDRHETDITEGFSRLRQAMSTVHISESHEEVLISLLSSAGFTSDMDVFRFAIDFKDRPEVISNILCREFEFSVMDAHKLRSAITHLLKDFGAEEEEEIDDKLPLVEEAGQPLPHNQIDSEASLSAGQDEGLRVSPFAGVGLVQGSRPVVTTGDRESWFYSVVESDLPALLRADLSDFYTFMTDPPIRVQEPAIRKATAAGYRDCAARFFGWYLLHTQSYSAAMKDAPDWRAFGLKTMFPNTTVEMIEPIFNYIRWMRRERKISSSYEHTVLRGMGKLMKYRFHELSNMTHPSFGMRTYDDIPAVTELRRFHNQAKKRAKLDPRVSDISKQWLPWPRYLQLVEELRRRADEAIAFVQEEVAAGRLLAADSPLLHSTSSRRSKAGQSRKAYRDIAQYYQTHLIFAFFACIPDRSRTMRELTPGSTLLREELDVQRGAGDISGGQAMTTHRYVIKHGPEDYKTGETYGDRPPLVIPADLTARVDEFLSRWRSHLQPQDAALFVSGRTGRAYTRTSFYEFFVRTAYKFTGKRTHPHLLRDMIVTHVRDTEASERELEALAIYMGHSIQMQRSTYDKRSMTQKVAPAVDLLNSLREQTQTQNGVSRSSSSSS